MVLVNWWFAPSIFLKTLRGSAFSNHPIFLANSRRPRRGSSWDGIAVWTSHQCWRCLSDLLTTMGGQFSLLPLKPSGGKTWSWNRNKSAHQEISKDSSEKSESCEAMVWVKSSQCQVPPPTRVYLKSWEGFSTSQAINEIPKIHLCCVQLVLHHFSCPNMSGWFHSLNAAIGDSFQVARCSIGA